MTKIVVGDKVRVTNPGQQYTTFDEWAARNRLSKWERHTYVKRGDELTVIVVATHSRVGGDMLLGLEDSNGKQFIIGLEGVDFVHRPFAANGVNGKGEPLNITADDLKPFQRVKVETGETAIVCVDSKGNKGLVYPGNMQSSIRFTTEGGSYYIIEVYDAPRIAQGVNFGEFGNLVWRSTLHAKAEAKRKADEAVAAAKAALAKAEAERAAL